MASMQLLYHLERLTLAPAICFLSSQGKKRTCLYINALHTTLPYTVFSNRNNSGCVHGTVWWQSGLSDVMLPQMGSPTPARRGGFTRDAMISHAAPGSVVGLWGSSAVWCVCVSLPSTSLSK